MISEKAQTVLSNTSATSFHLGKTAITTNNTYFHESSQANFLKDVKKLEIKAEDRKKQIKKLFENLKEKELEIEELRKNNKMSISDTLKTELNHVIKEFEENLENKYHRLEDELVNKQLQIDRLLAFIQEQNMENPDFSMINENEKEKKAHLKELDEKLEKIQSKLLKKNSLTRQKQLEYEEMLKFLLSEKNDFLSKNPELLLKSPDNLFNSSHYIPKESDFSLSPNPEILMGSPIQKSKASSKRTCIATQTEAFKQITKEEFDNMKKKLSEVMKDKNEAIKAKEEAVNEVVKGTDRFKSMEKQYQDRIKQINNENHTIQERYQMVLKDLETEIIAKNKEIEELSMKIGGSLSQKDKSLIEKELDVLSGRILDDFASVFKLLSINQQEFQHLDIECCFELLGKLLIQLLREKNELFENNRVLKSKLQQQSNSEYKSPQFQDERLKKQEYDTSTKANKEDIAKLKESRVKEKNRLEAEYSKTLEELYSFEKELRDFFLNQAILSPQDLDNLPLSELLKLLIECYLKEIEKYQSVSQEYHREYEAKLSELESKNILEGFDNTDPQKLQNEFLLRLQTMKENHKKELEALTQEKDTEKDEFVTELNQAIQDLYVQKRMLGSEKKDIENDLLKLKMKLSSEIQSKEDLQGKLAKKELEFSQKYADIQSLNIKISSDNANLKNENKELSQKIAKMSGEMIEMKKSFESFNLKNGQEITLYQDKLISLSNEISDLHQNNDFLLREFKIKLQEEKKNIEKIKEYEKLLNENELERKSLIERIQEAEIKLKFSENLLKDKETKLETLDEKTNDYKKVLDQIKLYKKLLEDKEIEIKSFILRLEEDNMKINVYEKNSYENNSKIVDLERKFRVLDQKNKENIDKLKEKEEKINELLIKISEFQGLISEKSQRIRELEGKSIVLAQGSEEKEEKLKDFLKEYEKLSQERLNQIEILSKENMELIEKLKEKTYEYGREIMIKEEKIIEYKGKNEELNKEFKILLETINAENKELKEKISNYKLKVIEFQEKQQTAEEKYVETFNKLIDFQKKSKELEDKSKEIDFKLLESNEKLQEANNLLKLAEKKSKDQEKIIQNISSDNHSNLDNLSAIKTHLSSELSSKLQIITQLTEKLDLETKKNKELEDQINKLISELSLEKDKNLQLSNELNFKLVREKENNQILEEKLKELSYISSKETEKKIQSEEQLIAELKKHQIQVIELSNKLSYEKQTNQALKLKYEELLSQKTLFELHLANQKEALQDFQSIKSQNIQNINDLQEALSSKDSEIEELKLEIASIKEKKSIKIKEMEDSIKVNQKNLQDTLKELADGEKLIGRLKEQLIQSQETQFNLDQTEKALIAIENERDRLVKVLKEAKENEESSKKETEKLILELQEENILNNQQKNEIQALKDEIGKNNKIIEELKSIQNKYQESLNVNNYLKEEINKINNKTNLRSENEDDIEEKYQEAQAVIINLNEQIIKNNNDINYNKDNITNQQKLEFERKYQESQTIIDHLNEEIGILKANNNLPPEINSPNKDQILFDNFNLFPDQGSFTPFGENSLMEDPALLKAQILNFEESLKKKTIENHDLNSKIIFLEEKIRDLENKNAEKQENIMFLEQRQASYNHIERVKQKGNFNFNPKNKKIDNQDEEKDQSIEKLQKMQSNLGEDMFDNFEDIPLDDKSNFLIETDLKSQIFSLENQLKLSKEEILMLKEKINSLEQKLGQKGFDEEMLDYLEDPTEKSNNNMDRSEIDYKLIDEQIKYLKSELEQTKRDSLLKVKEFELKLSELELEKSAIVKNIEILQKDKEELEKQLSEKNELVENKSNLQKVENENIILKMKIENLTIKVSSLELEIKRKSDKLKMEFEELLGENIENDNFNAVFDEGFDKLKGLKDKLEVEFRKLKDEVKKHQDEGLIQQEKLLDALNDFQNIEKMNEALQKKLIKREAESKQMIIMSNVFEKLFNEILKHSDEIYKENILELFELETKNKEHVDKIIEKIDNFLKKNKEKNDGYLNKIDKLEENIANLSNKSKQLEVQNAEIQKLVSLSQNKAANQENSFSSLKADFSELFAHKGNDLLEVPI